MYNFYLRQITHDTFTLTKIMNYVFESTLDQEKKRNSPIYFNRNYRTDMKLVPIVTDH